MKFILELSIALILFGAFSQAGELHYNCSGDKLELSDKLEVLYKTATSLQELLIQGPLYRLQESLGPRVKVSRVSDSGTDEWQVPKLGGHNFNKLGENQHPKPKPKPTTKPSHHTTTKGPHQTTPKPPPNPATTANPPNPATTANPPNPDTTATSNPNPATTPNPPNPDTTAPQDVTTPRPIPVVTTTSEGRRTTTPEGRRTTTAEGRRTTTPEGRRTTTPEGRRTTTSEGRRTTTAEGRRTTTAEGRRTTTSEGRRTTTQEQRRTTTPEQRRTTPPPAGLDLDVEGKEVKAEQLIVRIRDGEGRQNGFHLSVGRSGLSLSAGSLAGALRGLAELSQLRQTDAEGKLFLAECEVY